MTRMLVWGALVAVVSVGAFVLLDPILAAFIVILLVTGAGIALLARDWDRHSTFEERELARSKRRAEKWERNSDVRARDRAKWEAHQARQNERARTTDG
jgi:hypothetical protein